MRWRSAGIPCPVTAEIARTSRQSSCGDPLARLGRAGEVHLRHHQQLGPPGQGRAVVLQFLADVR